jgi:hypothetical protein
MIVNALSSSCNREGRKGRKGGNKKGGRAQPKKRGQSQSTSSSQVYADAQQLAIVKQDEALAAQSIADQKAMESQAAQASAQAAQAFAQSEE